MREFMRATAARDADKACGMLNGIGRRDMAAYPYRGGTRDTGRSCEQTVAQLDQLPHAAEASLSRGTMVVSVGAGLDNSNVRVEYDYGGRTIEADGSVQPNLGGGYDVTSPPTPPKTLPSPLPGQP